MDSDEQFTAIIRPHIKDLYRLSYRLTGNVPDAEDLLQDLLVKLYRRLDELRRIENLRPWLARVLYTLFIDMKRRSARSPIHLAVDNTGDERDVVDDQLNDQFNEPEATVMRGLDRQRLIEAIDQLSEEQRIVVMLFDVEGYTLNEMESILDCPQGTLKSRLHRARARLRELLG